MSKQTTPSKEDIQIVGDIPINPPVKIEDSPKSNNAIKSIKEKVTAELVESNKKSLALFSKTQKSIYHKLVKDIDANIKKVENSYLEIAYKIFQVYESKLYEIDNFANIYDFASEKFELARGTCNNYINIVKRFGIIVEDKCVSLLPEFQKYKPSQLILMLPMSDEQLKLITPDMTIRAIKDIKSTWADASMAISQSDAGTGKHSSPSITKSDTSYMDDEIDYCEDEIPNGAHYIPLAYMDNFDDNILDFKGIVNESLQDFHKNQKGIIPKITICLSW